MSHSDDSVKVSSSNRRSFMKMTALALAGSSAAGTAQSQTQESDTLTFTLDGKTIVIPKPQETTKKINKDLEKQENFDAFKSDPQAFSKKYGIIIDKDFSENLKTQMKDAKDIKAARGGNEGIHEATIWAVAAGSYSISSSKIAVAY